MAPKTEKARLAIGHVAEFIERLYRTGGFESWGDFGRQAGGIPAATMSDWKRGENAPSGYNLLRLIWAAERRNQEAQTYAALMTDPVVGMGIRIANELAFSDEAVARVEAVRAETNARLANAGGALSAVEDLRVELERVSQRVEQTRLLVVEGLGLQDRARELEAQLLPVPKDPAVVRDPG